MTEEYNNGGDFDLVAIGNLHRDSDEQIVFDSSGEIHIKDGMPVYSADSVAPLQAEIERHKANAEEWEKASLHWMAERDQLKARFDELESALKFYADREHYHFESGNWDTVSGEPLNILWCGDEPDFIENGTVARAALSKPAGSDQ